MSWHGRVDRMTRKKRTFKEWLITEMRPHTWDDVVAVAFPGHPDVSLDILDQPIPHDSGWLTHIHCAVAVWTKHKVFTNSDGEFGDFLVGADRNPSSDATFF